MKAFSRICTLAIATVAFSITGCADSSEITGPEVVPQQNLLGGLLGVVDGLLQKKAVKWTDAPGAPSVSAVIGSGGGRMSIPSADFTIDFPAGALSSNTTITVQVVRSSYVTYDMLPHGIRFRVPVTVTQGLHNTAAYDDRGSWSTLTGTYVLGDIIPNLLGLFQATEILNSKTYWIFDTDGRHPDYQTWQLNHFSRYMLASG
jgi:hypothetical protein